MRASRRLTYPLVFCLALGAAIACGDEKDSAADGKGGSGGSSGSDTGGGDTGGSGKGGTSGTGGCVFTGGNSGAANQCSTGGTGLVGGEGGEGGDDGPRVCNDLGPSMGPAVPETQRRGSIPTPTGGTIEDGTYFLTGWDVYPPELYSPVNTRTATLVIEGGHMELAYVEQAEPPGESWDYETSGSDIIIRRTCPVEDVDRFQYTATQASGAEFRLIDPRPRRSWVATYTKQ